MASSTRVTRRRFLAASSAALGVALSTGCAARARIIPANGQAPSANRRLEIARPSRFTILQLTDVHFFGGRTAPLSVINDRTMGIMERLVKATSPDVIVVTGDLWPDRNPELFETHMQYGIDACAALGVPWAFCWGNHDKLTDFGVGHRALARAANSLYGGSDSAGNYVVDIVDRRGGVVCQLVCLNSERDGLGPKQQQWLRAVPARTQTPRLAFFHIPIKQYIDVWDNGPATGFYAEKRAIEKEDGSSLAVLKAAGVKACFCGHDHVNDYSGFADGVELVYGRATGAGGYGKELLPKGGKLITVDCATDRYKWETVLPDGSRWEPKPGERIQRIKTT